MTINGGTQQIRPREAPEWIHMCSERPTYHPVEDALGLTHEGIWRELKHKAVDIVLTENDEPFEVRHRSDKYDPICDLPDHTIMHFCLKTEDYTDHFTSLLKEYYSVQHLNPIRFRYHQAGFLKSVIPPTMVFLNPFREVKIEYALNSRFLAIQENGQQKILRIWDRKKFRHSWIYDYINLKLEEEFQWLLMRILSREFTPTDYYFYIYEKYQDTPIIERNHDSDRYKTTYQMANGDMITLWNTTHFSTIVNRMYTIDSTVISINDHKIEEFFVPLNKIPPECVQTDFHDSSESKVYCLPDYYFSYPDPYKYAYQFPLHMIEHLPIQCYDPPYVILDSTVRNTPFGMYFQ